MSNTQQSTNKLCLGCQQFFGNPANDNMCSSCFKKKMQSNSANNTMAAQQLPPPQISQAVNELFAPAEKPAVVEKIVEEIPAEIVPPTKEAAKPCQDDHSRCWNCKKKVNLLGVKCKCDFTFCNKHRMPEDHACSYDHAAFGRDLIKQNNPLVQKAKLEKI